MKKFAFSAVLAVVCLLGFSRSAFAHAVLVSSTPKINDTLRGPGVAITLKFNSRVDSKRSKLLLVLPNGAEQMLILTKQDALDELDARVELSPGKYALHWQALSSDGHITRGEVPFIVK